MVARNIATRTELFVVGARPGSYAAAIRTAQNGIDTILVEKGVYGSTCLNYGCIPSKVPVAGANPAYETDNAREMDVYADPIVGMLQPRGWRSGVVDQLTGGVEKLCKANGVNLVEGTVRFKDENVVRVAHGGGRQGLETIGFEYCTIAANSRAIQVPGFDFSDGSVWLPCDTFEADTVPERLVVVGGGHIGMEPSTTFARFGTDVTVVEMLDNILPGYEPDVARVVRKRAGELGISVHLDEGANGWREEDDGIVVTVEIGDDEENEHCTNRALVTVGRSPVTGTMDTESTGLEADDHGLFSIDDRHRTDVGHIYAADDVVEDAPMPAHVVLKEGIVAAERVASEPVAFGSQAVPTAVFTDPEIGTVGMIKADTEEAGLTSVVGQTPSRASGRVLTTNHVDGFVRVVADEEFGFVLGVQIAGPEAFELIAELAFIIEAGTALEDVASTIHTHLTPAEAVMEAAEDALGQAIHALNR